MGTAHMPGPDAEWMLPRTIHCDPNQPKTMKRYELLILFCCSTAVLGLVVMLAGGVALGALMIVFGGAAALLLWLFFAMPDMLDRLSRWLGGKP